MFGRAGPDPRPAAGWLEPDSDPRQADRRRRAARRAAKPPSRTVPARATSGLAPVVGSPVAADEVTGALGVEPDDVVPPAPADPVDVSVVIVVDVVDEVVDEVVVELPTPGRPGAGA